MKSLKISLTTQDKFDFALNLWADPEIYSALFIKWAGGFYPSLDIDATLEWRNGFPDALPALPPFDDGEGGHNAPLAVRSYIYANMAPTANGGAGIAWLTAAMNQWLDKARSLGIFIPDEMELDQYLALRIRGDGLDQDGHQVMRQVYCRLRKKSVNAYLEEMGSDYLDYIEED